MWDTVMGLGSKLHREFSEWAYKLQRIWTKFQNQLAYQAFKWSLSIFIAVSAISYTLSENTQAVETTVEWEKWAVAAF